MFNQREFTALVALVMALVVGVGVIVVEHYRLAAWEEFHVVPKAVELATLQKIAPIAPIVLNKATTTQLQRLPGIGPKMAHRIVAFRQEYGIFRSLEDLTLVKGVGQRTLENFRSQLVLNAD